MKQQFLKESLLHHNVAKKFSYETTLKRLLNTENRNKNYTFNNHFGYGKRFKNFEDLLNLKDL